MPRGRLSMWRNAEPCARFLLLLATILACETREIRCEEQSYCRDSGVCGNVFNTWTATALEKDATVAERKSNQTKTREKSPGKAKLEGEHSEKTKNKSKTRIESSASRESYWNCTIFATSLWWWAIRGLVVCKMPIRRSSGNSDEPRERRSFFFTPRSNHWPITFCSLLISKKEPQTPDQAADNDERILRYWERFLVTLFLFPKRRTRRKEVVAPHHPFSWWKISNCMCAHGTALWS